MNKKVDEGGILTLKQFEYILMASVFVLLSACSYKFTGGGELPKGIKTVHISVFKNNTNEIGLENFVTEDLINEFVLKRKDALTGEDKAEGLLTGIITAIHSETISRRGERGSLERRVTVTVQLKLSRPDGKLVWSARNISEHEEYDVDSDKAATDFNRRIAIAQLSKRLAERMFNRLTDDF